MESTTPGDLFTGPVNIKWEEGTPAPVGCIGHTAVWLNGLVYVGCGYKTGGKYSYTINCYNPVNNLWSYPINTPYCHFAMTTLNNNLLIAGGQDKHYRRTNQILIMDAGQLNNYTKMTTARAYAIATGHQGMLIITGVGITRARYYPLLNYLMPTINNGTFVATYYNHTCTCGQ